MLPVKQILYSGHYKWCNTSRMVLHEALNASVGGSGLSFVIAEDAQSAESVGHDFTGKTVCELKALRQKPAEDEIFLC